MTTHAQYVSVCTSDAERSWDAAGVWVQWSTASGRKGEEAALGPIVIDLEPTEAMLAMRVDWILEDRGYRRVSDWSQADHGLVAWVEHARHAPLRQPVVAACAALRRSGTTRPRGVARR